MLVIDRSGQPVTSTRNVGRTKLVRRVSGSVTRYPDAQMAMRWVAAEFLKAEKAIRMPRGWFTHSLPLP